MEISELVFPILSIQTACTVPNPRIESRCYNRVVSFFHTGVILEK